MTRRHIKLGCFTLEALNSFAGTFFLFYLFFLTRDEFGFGSRANLFLTALHGFIYVFASWQGGRFAQRFGYFTALKCGYVGMALGLSFGLIVPGLTGQIIALLSWTIPCCLIWPSLEALVTEGEAALNTSRMVGIYNLVWSGAGALAYFSGGWIWDRFGRSGLYGIPIVIMVAQLTLTILLARNRKQPPAETTSNQPSHEPEPAARDQPVPPSRFLQMAWLSNPFAYVAINTMGAVIPQLAEKFHLSPTQSGVFCSLWYFVRVAAFFIFWRWTGWHYRFRWLLAAFIGLVFSFASLLLAGQLWMVVAAQAVFGFSVGLIYYSSLFYSMDAGDTKGDHGGLHEAAIGLGICVGPALGAITLTLLPEHPNSGALAVTALLVCGLLGLIWMRFGGKTNAG